MDDAWRVLVVFDGKEDTRAVADYLKAMGDVAAAGGSISVASDKTSLFAYAPTVEVIENVARLIGSSANSLRIKPSEVSLAHWLGDESQWSDQERTPIPAGDGPVAEGYGFLASVFGQPIC